MMGYKTENNGTVPEKYEEYKKQIIRSIKDWHCTLPQIKGFAGISRSDDISEVLTFMIDQGEVVRLQNEKMTAYFLPEKLPSKFWLSGDGRTAVEFAEEKTKAEATGKKEHNPNFTKENFYNWGKKNFGSKEIAAELGISFQAVAVFLRWNPEMQDSLTSGKNDRVDEPLAENINSEMKSQDLIDALIEETVKETSEEQETKQAPAEKREVYEGFQDSPPVIAGPEEKALEAREYSENDTVPFESPLCGFNEGEFALEDDLPQSKVEEIKLPEVKEISEPVNLPISNEDLPVQSPPVEPKELAKTPPFNTLEEFKVKEWKAQPQEGFFIAELLGRKPSAEIDFGPGGKIEIFADVNLFALDYDTRQFVNQLISVVQDFKGKKGQA